MDFFAMKRKKLQSYCKKHGIPANLKNIEMAKQLTLIYQGKENQNPASPQFQADEGANKDKLNVEVIDLDSDIGADDVQMEATDTVAGNVSIEKTNLSDEHEPEEEPDQLSEVKSDHKVDSGSAVVNEDACEVKSASSQKTSHGREESKLNSPSEGDDIGSVNVHESMQMRVNKEKNEDNQELHPASSNVDANMVDVEHEVLSEQIDVDEDMSETEKVGDEAEKQDKEPDQILTTSLSEVKSDHKVDSGTADACEVKSTSSRKISQGQEESKFKSPPEGDDIGSVNVEERMQMSINREKNEDTQELHLASASEDACEVKSASTPKTSQGLEESKLKSPPEGGDGIGSVDEEESMEMNVDEEKTEESQELDPASQSEDENMVMGEVEVLSEKTKVHEDSSGTRKVEDEAEKIDQINIYQGSVMENVNSLNVSSPKESSGCSVEQVQNFNDNYCVMEESAAMCLDASTGVENTDENTNVAVQDTLDKVHSSNDPNEGTPVQVLPTDPNEVETSDLDVHELVVTGTATKNADTIGVNFESSQKMSITPASQKLIGSSTKLLSNSVTPRDIDVFDVEENIQIGVNQEQDDHGQEKTMDFSPNMLSNLGTPASDSEESLQIDANKENIDPGEGWNAERSAVDMSDDEDLTQSVSEELGNDLIEGQVANRDNEIDLQDVCGSGNGSGEAVNKCGINSPHVSPMESNGRVVEQLHKLDDNNCVLSEAATVRLDASAGAKNIDENTNLTVEGILDAVHLSSFENSSVQFPPIDPLREVETNDLAVHKMAATDTSGVKVVSESLDNDLMEEEVADVDDKFDLVEDVSETGNGSKEVINQGSIDSPHGSNVNNADLLHVSPVESSSPLVGGQVQKSDDNVMDSADYDLGNCGFGIDILFSHDKTIAAEDTDAKTNVSMENIPYESHAPSAKLSEEFGKKLAEVEFNLLEDDCETAKCKDKALNSSGIKSSPESIINDFNLLHDSLGDFSSYFDGEVQKSDDKIMHCGSGKSESGVDAFCFPDESIAAKNIDGKNNESMQKNSYEGNSSSVQYSDGTHDLFVTTGQLISSSTYPMAALDVYEEEMLRSSEKACMVADPEECIGFSANDFEASTNKGFEAETCFDPNTVGDVVIETCNMNESMQIVMMEKHNSQGDGMDFFENSDVHDGIGGVGAEEDNQPDTVNRKRKRNDANSDEEVQDELVPTVPQTSEMELSNFRLQQLFASDTASGDEDAYQKKLDSPSKATPMIHKENIRFDKKEDVGSVMSRNKFAKRQPLQDLKQN